MSYWVHLENRSAKPWCTYGSQAEGSCPTPCYPAVEVPNHSEGGTYAMGGIAQAELNLTYNYSRFFREALDREDGLRWLHDKRASECIGRLADAVGLLGVERDEDYWAPTRGNAGHALSILLEWAKAHPEAVFRVS